ncbi:MAG: hypothetical protein WCE21_01025 [Candidatus Babeliales bacterium]
MNRFAILVTFLTGFFVNLPSVAMDNQGFINNSYDLNKKEMVLTAIAGIAGTQFMYYTHKYLTNYCNRDVILYCHMQSTKELHIDVHCNKDNMNDQLTSGAYFNEEKNTITELADCKKNITHAKWGMFGSAVVGLGSLYGLNKMTQ